MDETSNLGRLLAELAPRLGEEHYVFCHVPGGHLGEWVDAAPIASFAEPEGLTLVMHRAHADRKGLAYDDESELRSES